ncbi:MAG: CotH kinase family protein [Ignavibacteriales bacterium]|nr:CotH kinase family protein [Ignavibacteriales bacterium]
MLDTAKAGSDGYIMAQSVTVNGTEYDSVGVKYKGNSTYNPNYIKNPFHIELDTYKEQDYQGYKDIKLSNVAKDPSFLREVLSYSILRKYMNASLSNYANVYVNGTLLGLYVSSESIGKTFVNKNFYSKDNAFIKCNPIDGAGPGSTDLPNLVYLGTDSTLYYPAYELKSDYGWADLITLTNTLKNNIGEIETVLDVDRALWMLAFDNLLVNLDSYIGVFAQNYYLYKDNIGRFNCMLWDFNESFGTFSQTGTIFLPNTTAKSQMTHLLHSGDANWPLVQKLLAVPTYKKMYLAHLHTILTENFSNNSYYTLAQSIQPIINAAVQADPNKFYTYTQYQSNLTTDVGIGPNSVPGITALMNGRNTYLSALSDFTNTKPTITNVAPSDTNPTLNTTVFITANVINTNTDAVYLGHRDNNENRFTKILMYDDGAHGDGTAGDNIYGASIDVSSSTIQYYIYAENNNVGMFSPVRAEHEFYTMTANTTTSSEVMMNEIYTRGTTTDPDWIEIYNSSTSAIDISGYKIYDSGGQSGTKPKKEFSTGSVIPSNGFLVIVTDDTSASGFGLSSSGEKVWLENSLGLIADSVTFPALTVDQSSGRIPDGGVWQTLDTITRGASNSSPTGISEEPLSITEFKLDQNYPNPFNPTTTISFQLPVSSQVTLKIYDLLGKEIVTLVDEMKNAGSYQFNFDASQLASGMYFYRLDTKNFSQVRKMILLK